MALIGVWLGGKADVWGGKRIWVFSAIAFAITLAGWGIEQRDPSARPRHTIYQVVRPADLGRFEWLRPWVKHCLLFGRPLALAPGSLVGQLCRVVDLDGPIFLRNDRSPGVVYENGTVWCPPEVWGGGAR